MQLSRNFRHRSAPRAPIGALCDLDAPEQFRGPQSAGHCMWPPCETRSSPVMARRPFSRRCSEPQRRSSSSHSVPSMQFQVLLTCLSAFFSTFLRSTFPLSVFMSYLDLGEIYLLLYAEITINVTLKEAEIWRPFCKPPTREFHPLCCSFPTDFRLLRPHLATSSKGASVWRLYCRQTLFL